MDAFSPIQALGPAAAGSLPGGSLLSLGNAASLRAAGGCCGAHQAQGMDPLMQTQNMLGQMLQILLMLMVGQGQNGQGAAAGLPGVGGVGAPGGGGAAAGSSSVSNPAVNSNDQGEIQGFIREAAAAYGADANVLIEMARRESSFKTDAVNNWDSNAAKGTPSKGLFQFIEPTFNSMAPKAKAANPGAWANMGPFNWNDWRQQALVAAWAIANGQGSHWATYKAAGGR